MAVPAGRTRMYAEQPAGVAVPVDGARVSWGGVWSGFLVALGSLILLSTLGLAIGISAVDIAPGAGVDAGGLGVGAAIWAGLSLLVALFVGGLVAARTGMVVDATASAVQGALVWVLAVLGIIYMASSGVSLVAGAVGGVFGGVSRGMGAALGGADLAGLASGDVDQILAKLDDPRTIATISSATGTPEAEVRATVASVRERVAAVRADPAKATAEARAGLQQFVDRAAERATGAAAAAQPYASATTWTTFGVMVLSLLAALGGAAVGRTRAAARIGAT